MTSNKPPSWVAESVRHARDTTKEPAEKLAHAESLSTLWRAIEREFLASSWLVEFFGNGDRHEGMRNYFNHLTNCVALGLLPPRGYKAMTPAKLGSWRKKTQKSALDLLHNLMDGYPDIEEKRDQAWTLDKWQLDAAVTLATNGERTSLEGWFELEGQSKADPKKLAGALAMTARPQILLVSLIHWLDYQAAVGHTTTHAAAATSHRNSFIRSLTGHFEQTFCKPMRSHVYNIAALYFDMGNLAPEDIKKIAPANGGGKNPETILQNIPGEEST